MKPFLLLLSLSLLLSPVRAQDTLFFASGEIQVVRILELTPSYLRYKPFDLQDGPAYMLLRSKLARVVFEDGSSEIFFLSEESASPALSTPTQASFYRNITSLNILELPFGGLTFGYELLSKSGNWGFRIPISFGLKALDPSGNSSWIYFYDGNKIFSTGLSGNFYPFGQNRFTYFTGISFVLGWFKYIDYDYDFWIGFFRERMKNSHYTGMAVHTGCTFKIDKHLDFSLLVGLGLGKSYDQYGYTVMRVPVEINFGYSF